MGKNRRRNPCQGDSQAPGDCRSGRVVSRLWIAGPRAPEAIMARNGQHRARPTGRSRLPTLGAGRRSSQPLHVSTPGSPLLRHRASGHDRRPPPGDVLPESRLYRVRSLPGPTAPAAGWRGVGAPAGISRSVRPAGRHARRRSGRSGDGGPRPPGRRFSSQDRDRLRPDGGADRDGERAHPQRRRRGRHAPRDPARSTCGELARGGPKATTWR